MTIAIIITLFVLALMLCLVETFLIPGFGVCGALSAICAIAGVIVTFVGYGPTYGTISAAAVLVAGVLLFYWVMHSKRLESISLHAQIDSSVANEECSSICVGDRGVALTRLALVGNARIGDVECEVRSQSGFVEEGTRIVVSKLSMGEIYVKVDSENHHLSE